MRRFFYFYAMKQQKFLHIIAQELLNDFGNELYNATIVLPNNRAKIFLLNALKSKINNTVFAPNIISIEQFTEEVSELRKIDSINLLFEFYKVYQDLTIKEDQRPISEISGWVKMLLQDFNDIDKYLIRTKNVFSFLKEIEALKRWNLSDTEKTQIIERQLDFWNKLPQYYTNFQNHLLKDRKGYQGLVYKKASEKILNFALNTNSFYYFIGFNALSKAEEVIFQELLKQNKAKIFWDIDQFFLENTYHDAGYFLRSIKSKWKYYQNNTFNFVHNDYQSEKQIKIIATAKSVGQAKIVGSIISEIQKNYNSLNNTAIVLADENLLLPTLYALPKSADAVNITMGFPAKSNPVQQFISKLFKLHTNAINRNKKRYTYYYKEVLDVLQNPIIENYFSVSEVVNTINFNNITFFSEEFLFKLKSEKSINADEHFFNLLFKNWQQKTIDEIVNTISEILYTLNELYSKNAENNKLNIVFIYAVYKNINLLKTYINEQVEINNIEILYNLYNELADLSEISFEGEPLSGLQIMGVLESRVLDFENVIITSLNEGKFPSAKMPNSIIPFDVKSELELPIYKEKDAIFCYHFYHLLFRAKNIWLLYNNDSEGLDAGEMSRYLLQLQIENQPNHNISHIYYNAETPVVNTNKSKIIKNNEVLLRLYDICKALSPSAIINYLRNPIEFYYKRILRINEVDEVEENIALNTLGTIIHNTLENLYKPYLGIYLKEEHINEMFKISTNEVKNQFKKVYKEGNIKKGKNLLAFEVAKRNIYNFLNKEKETLENRDTIEIIYLEEKFSYTIIDDRLPVSVTISGKIDRIEKRNGIYRIIDYKTGKVEPKQLQIENFDELFLSYEKEKIIQIMCYVLMISQTIDFENSKLEIGMISFKNLSQNFIPFVYDINNKKETIINLDILREFKESLILFLIDFLDKDKAFTEKD